MKRRNDLTSVGTGNVEIECVRMGSRDILPYQ